MHQAEQLLRKLYDATITYDLSEKNNYDTNCLTDVKNEVFYYFQDKDNFTPEFLEWWEKIGSSRWWGILNVTHVPYESKSDDEILNKAAKQLAFLTWKDRERILSEQKIDDLVIKALAKTKEYYILYDVVAERIGTDKTQVLQSLNRLCDRGIVEQHDHMPNFRLK